jgi:hypothetical protein
MGIVLYLFGPRGLNLRKKKILWSCVVIAFHPPACSIEPIVGSFFLFISLLPQKFSSPTKQSLVYILCILTPCTIRGKIPPSVHAPHALPCIENRYVPLLELVAYSQNSFPPIYHNIHLTMKK